MQSRTVLNLTAAVVASAGLMSISVSLIRWAPSSERPLRQSTGADRSPVPRGRSDNNLAIESAHPCDEGNGGAADCYPFTEPFGEVEDRRQLQGPSDLGAPPDPAARRAPISDEELKAAVANLEAAVANLDRVEAERRTLAHKVDSAGRGPVFERLSAESARLSGDIESMLDEHPQLAVVQAAPSLPIVAELRAPSDVPSGYPRTVPNDSRRALEELRQRAPDPTPSRSEGTASALAKTLQAEVGSLRAPQPTPASELESLSAADEASALNDQSRSQGGRSLRGGIWIDAPVSAKENEPFDIDVWVEAYDDAAPGEFTLHMGRTSSITFEPRTFNAKAGERRSVTVTVEAARGGLAEIVVSGDRLKTGRASFDLGYNANLRLKVPTGITSDGLKTLSAEFVNESGHPVPIGASVRVQLEAAGAVLRAAGTTEWVSDLELHVVRGDSASPLFEIAPETYFKPEGSVQARVLMAEFRRVLQTSPQHTFSITPAWWLCLLATIAGGLGFGFYREIRRKLDRRRLPHRLTMAALAGGVAYLIALSGFLGITIDETEARGYVLMGFLVAYLGIEQVMERVLPPKKPA